MLNGKATLHTIFLPWSWFFSDSGSLLTHVNFMKCLRISERIKCSHGSKALSTEPSTG